MFRRPKKSKGTVKSTTEAPSQEWVIVSPEDEPESPFSRLPAESRLLIMEFLPGRDLVSMTQVDKESRALAFHELDNKLKKDPDACAVKVKVKKKASWISQKMQRSEEIEEVTAVSYFLHTNRIDLVKHFVNAYMDNEKSKAKYPDYLNDLLFDAIHEKKHDMVIYLLAKGANPNCKNKEGYSPLGEAVKMGNFEICNTLYEKGALPFDPSLNEDVKQPISLALREQFPSKEVENMVNLFLNDPQLFAMLDTNFEKRLKNAFWEHQSSASKTATYVTLGLTEPQFPHYLLKNAKKNKKAHNDFARDLNAYISYLTNLHSKQGGQDIDMTVRIALLTNLRDIIQNNSIKTPLENVKQWITNNKNLSENFSKTLIQSASSSKSFLSSFSKLPEDFSDQRFLQLLSDYAGKKIVVKRSQQKPPTPK